MHYTITPIGSIKTPYATKQECPVQGVADPEAKGEIHLDEKFIDGLKSIDSFSHLYLFYIFDRAGEIELQRQPFLDDEVHGIFATRHPCRPNSLGISIVRLLGVSGNILQIAEVDMLNNSPLVDIKPYLPRFDLRSQANNGWFENLDFRNKPPGRE